MALGFWHVGCASQFLNPWSIRFIEIGWWTVVFDTMAKAEAKLLVVFLHFQKELTTGSEDSGQVLVGVSVLGWCSWCG